MAKLNTETNTPAMEVRVLLAAQAALDRENLAAVFEHGQWWVCCLDTSAQWSVCDAVGPSTVDGFGFEQVTEGEED